jgi:hypothetical protein
MSNDKISNGKLSYDKMSTLECQQHSRHHPAGPTAGVRLYPSSVRLSSDRIGRLVTCLNLEVNYVLSFDILSKVT